MELLRQHSCPTFLENLAKKLPALELPPDTGVLTEDYVQSPIFTHPSAYSGRKYEQAATNYESFLFAEYHPPSDPAFDWFRITDREPWKRTMLHLPDAPSERDFIFRRLEYSPGLPLIPGRPGTILAPRAKRLIARGCTASLVVALIKPNLCEIVPELDERWRYMGEYE